VLTLDEVNDFIIKATNELTKEMLISICSYNYIFANYLWTIYGVFGIDLTFGIESV